jgi:hypothetical protein
MLYGHDAAWDKGYREVAKSFRDRAADCREYDLQEQMLALASGYEQLARVLEQGLRITTTPR